MSDRVPLTPREIAESYLNRSATTTLDRQRAEIAASVHQGDQLGRLAEALMALVPPVPALVPPDQWVDSVDADERVTRIPVWVFDSWMQIEGVSSIAAEVEGIVAADTVVVGPDVDAIERDAHRLLTAVAWHRHLVSAARQSSAPDLDQRGR